MRPLGSGESLVDHWYDRPGWTAATRYLTWHLLPEAAALRRSVEEHHRVLAHVENLDLVPVPWLHVTVQGVGFADRVGVEARQAVVAAARRHVRQLPPVELSLAPAAPYRESVGMRAGPDAPVRALRDALRAAVRETLGDRGVEGNDDDQVRPHLSLAYACGAVPADRVRAAVAPVVDRGVDLRIDRVSLIELRKEGHLYCWQRLADVELAGVRPGSA